MATIKQKCPDSCCACQESCECEEIGFRVGFALYPPSHPRGGTPRPDPDASLCCNAKRPGFWWNEPPSSITGQLVGAEVMSYEIWAEDAATPASSCLLCGGDGTPEYLPDRCALHHLVLVVDSVTARGQPGAAGALTEGPTATRLQWYGASDLDGCCKRWPNFFLKIVARAGLSVRTLAICRALWGGVQGDPLCNAVVETGDNPCPCGVFEECAACPEDDGITSVTFTISVNGTPQTVSMTRAGSFTGLCGCPGNSWVANFGMCGRNHTALLCATANEGNFLSVFQQTSTYEPEFELTGSAEGAGCGAGDVGVFSWSAGADCGFDETTEITVSISAA